MRLSIFRYHPERDARPRMQAYEVEPARADRMLLDLLLRLRETDDSLAFRRSCREGACGSDAMDINGDGLYECILCGCCSGFCTPYWWNPDKYIGPAGLLQAYRFIADSRDRATREWLDFLDDVYRLYRCRTIMNCTEVCPKQLSPSRAIERIRALLLDESF